MWMFRAALPFPLSAVRTVADEGCRYEPEYSDGNCHDRRRRPSELVDETAERARTGKLAQITRLLNKPDHDGDGFGRGRVPGAAA